MIYLSGVTNDKIEPDLLKDGIGLIVQPGTGYARRLDRFPFWAADNGCFNPKTYVGDLGWLDWLDRLPRDGCLFATVPDVARRPDGSLGGDPAATWAKFQELSEVVRDMGFPAALVAQNGMERLPDLAAQLDACDALFIGGDTTWKLGPEAEKVCRQARNAGRWVHVGRCNSRKRIERARSMGATSVDGTFLGFGPDKNLPRLRRWLLWLDMHQPFPQFLTFEGHTLDIHRKAAQ